MKLLVKNLLVLVFFSFLIGCGSNESPKKLEDPSVKEPKPPAVSESIYENFNIDPLSADATGMDYTAIEISEAMKLGWNIGNTLEATGSETAWGNPKVNQALIQLVKENGFNAIRIPASWDQYANQASAEIDPLWLDRVKEVVQICIDNDLFVIVNIHWDGGWLEGNIDPSKQIETNDKQRAYWQQISTHLRDFDYHLMFASANEPHAETEEQMQVLHSYHQTFVDAVRETGGKNSYRTLIVQGPKTDIELTDALWVAMPNDTVDGRLMMEIHFYTPYNFAGLTSDQSWGDQFFYWGKDYTSITEPNRNANWGDENTVDSLLKSMKTKFVDKGIPVIVGEFGAIRRDDLTGEALALHLDSRAYYLNFVTKKSIEYGFTPFYWDDGSNSNKAFGIFDRVNNEVYDQQALNALLQTTTP